jgi:hypothetical protein
LPASSDPASSVGGLDLNGKSLVIFLPFESKMRTAQLSQQPPCAQQEALSDGSVLASDGSGLVHGQVRQSGVLGMRGALSLR